MTDRLGRREPAPPRAIRVAIDAHAIGRNATGAETYITGLLRGLDGVPDVEPVVLVDRGTAPPRGASMATGSIHWRHPAGRLLGDLRAVGRRWGAQLVHTQFVRPPVCDVPSVTTIHDLSFERYPEFFSRRMWARLRLTVPWSARHSAAVLTGSEHARSELVDLYRLPGDRVHVTPYAADERFAPIPAERSARTLRELGLQAGFLLCVGNLQPRKNLDRVVTAYARLAPSVRPRLVFVGPPGWRSARTLETVRKYGLERDIHFAGYVSMSQLVALYNGAVAFAYPSLYEGFGLPVVEAMACGTPTLTSDVSCLPEVAGDAAVLVDPFDAEAIRIGLERLLTDTQLRADLRAAGIRRAATFSWDRCGRETVAVYKSVLGGRAG